MGLADDRGDAERMVVEAVEDLVGRRVDIEARTTLAELGIDSLGLVELALALEQERAIELRPDDYDCILTIGDLYDIVASARQ